MKKVSIFIAGSTVLQNQRNSLKALAGDLNCEFEKDDVQLRVFSYESFKDNQNSYNKFITDKADIVLVIIDGKIGNKTREEFDLAKQTLDNSGRPKILVFVHRQEQVSFEIAHFEGYVEASTGDYCITYNDDTDLAKQVEIRLRRYLSANEETIVRSNQLKKPKATNITHKNVSFGNSNWSSILLVFSVAIILGTVYYLIHHQDNSLIIAGGGSAANHISKVAGFDITNYDEAMYMHLPSGSAWQLLTEEYLSNSKNSNQRYTPVCVSASAASDSSFLSNIITKADFVKKASVVEFNMGNDSLVVYAELKPYMRKILAKEINSGTITMEKLADIAINKRDSINILPTSPKSGTRITYHNILENFGFDLSSVQLTFSNLSSPEHMKRDSKPYMVLGTAAYYPVYFETAKGKGEHVALTLLDSNSTVVTKPVFLYCLIRDEGNDDFSFTPKTKQLLKALHQDTIREFSEILNAPHFKRTDPDVILKPSQLYISNPH